MWRSRTDAAFDKVRFTVVQGHTRSGSQGVIGRCAAINVVWLQVDSVAAGKVDIEALKLWDSTAPLNFCPVPSRCKQCTQPERPAPMAQLPELTARFIKKVQQPDATERSFKLI